MTSRLSQLAEEALNALQKRPHIVGVARDRFDHLTFLLDQDDKMTRSAVEHWAKVHGTRISIKVIGKIVSN
jgi:hypothetical protein